MTRKGKKRKQPPVSLHPLSVEEALKGLLDTKPPPKARSQKKNQNQVKAQKKRAKRREAKKG